MPRIAVVAPERAARVPAPDWAAGAGETRAYLDRACDPIHVHEHRLDAGAVLRVGPHGRDMSLYVGLGAVTAAACDLPVGSSVLIERGATVELRADDGGAVLFSFAAAAAEADAPVVASARIHLLPVADVPRYGGGEPGGVEGGLHADASDPRCPIWLHENRMPAPDPVAAPADRDAGIHAHGEDEVILVTGGGMRLGARLCGPGTLLAVAAGTMYGFTVGPDGLAFVNFRPGRPDVIRFKRGAEIDEVGYWRARVAPPRYVTLPGRGARDAA